MGMGEPLANLDNLLDALDVAGHKDGLGIGPRHVTISTVGLPAKIRRLADLGKQYHLAVSLHAPNDALRNRIVPTNDKTGLDDILEAADYFFEKTGRQVTFEYVLLGGLNDGPAEARQLADLLRGRQAHVNLIPFNDVAGLPYRRPAPEAQQTFVDALRRAGVSVKVRKRKGAEIDAACGQLRRAVGSSRTAGCRERIVEAVRRTRGVTGRRRRRCRIGETSAQMALRDPDIRLMLRVRDADDAGAFGELVEHYQHRLVGVMHHLVGSADEAEDLAQEVFLRVYRARKKYRPRAKFSTWLFTIANNLALNALRRRQRKPAVPLPAQDSGPLGPRPAEQLVARRRAAPPSQQLAAAGAGRRHPAGARRAQRAAADGGRPQQVRGHELRRDRRGHGPDDQGGQVAAEPGPLPAPRRPHGLPVRR